MIVITIYKLQFKKAQKSYSIFKKIFRFTRTPKSKEKPFQLLKIYMQTAIQLFLEQNPRNKIIITTRDLEDITYLNVGYDFSKILLGIESTNQFALKAKYKLNELLESNIKKSKKYPEYLALTNIGILLEPKLKLDLISFLDGYSRNNPFFIHWPGKIEENHLYFGRKGIRIDLNNLGHLTI